MDVIITDRLNINKLNVLSIDSFVDSVVSKQIKFLTVSQSNFIYVIDVENVLPQGLRTSPKGPGKLSLAVVFFGKLEKGTFSKVTASRIRLNVVDQNIFLDNSHCQDLSKS
jgi:hypothetical protein